MMGNSCVSCESEERMMMSGTNRSKKSIVLSIEEFFIGAEVEAV